MLNGRLSRRSLINLTGAAVAAGVLAEPVRAGAASTDEPVVAWLNRQAVPLPRLDAGGPVHDLRSLSTVVGTAQVVGLGESAHGTREQFTLKHRAVRFLVECLGFRTLSWEENWGSGVAIDRYVVGGEGDPRELVAATSSLWRSEEMLDLVRWMREYNLSHEDKVRFLGTDLTQLRQLLFDEIVAYVRDIAPNRIDDLERDLDPIRLTGDAQRHVGWYLQQPDKQPYIDHARAVYDLVLGLPPGPSRIGREYAVQHARTILGFYEYYAVQLLDQRDRFMADTLTWWQRRTRHRVVYWAANVHTAASPLVTYSLPPFVPPTQAVVAGSHLRQRYGRRYVSVGTMFHTGEVLTGWENGSPSVFQVPPPSGIMVDHVLGRAKHPDFVLDLHADAPLPVRRWLNQPATMRLIGSAYNSGNDSAYAMSVESWISAFDAILHLDTTTPVRLL
ncbi:erythromycin esterase family protein [Micromonospora sp. NPDC047074]|uniref:erythromycin esterase family protein n=1 Tax=Micromonospora sp. NPDC047074 TaxID=3154339 RepID=UPI0033E7F774